MEKEEKNIHEEIKEILNNINELTQRGKDIRFDKYEIEKIRKNYIANINELSNYDNVYENSMRQMLDRPDMATTALRVNFADRNKTFEKYDLNIAPLEKQIMDMNSIEAETDAQIFEQIMMLNNYKNENDLTEEEKETIEDLNEKHFGETKDMDQEELKAFNEHLQIKRQNTEAQMTLLNEEIKECQEQMYYNGSDCQNIINTGIREGTNIQEFGEKYFGKIRDDYQNLSKQIFDNTILLELSGEISYLNLELYKMNYLLNEKENNKQMNKINDPEIRVNVILQDVLGNQKNEDLIDFKQNIEDAISDVKTSDLEDLKQRIKEDNEKGQSQKQAETIDKTE